MRIILLSLLLVCLNAVAQTGAQQGTAPAQKHGCHNKAGHASGPHSFTPKGSANKTGIPPNHYHNEQDDFRRKDNPNYHPAPAPQKGQPDDPHSDISPLKHYKETQADPTVTFGFSAESCPNNDPPDNSMAISAGGNIVSAVNCGLFFYNSSGTLLGQSTYPTFFNTSTDMYSDPRVIYDMYNDRFIFFIQFGNSPSNSVIYVAFSSSNDPTQSWTYYSYTVPNFEANTWFDYPSVGINNTDLCITGNLFNASNTSVGNLVLLINKQSGYAGGTITDSYWTNVNDGTGFVGFTLAPATSGQNVSYSNVMYLVSTVSTGAGSLTLYTINGSAGNSPTIAATLINTPQAYLPSSQATQPSGIALANTKAGCRVESAMFLNGIVHFVFSGDYNVSGSDYNSIYYNRIDVSTSTLQQNWSYLGGSNYNYPSLASYGTGSTDQTVIVQFLKSDASTFPEVRCKYFDANMNQLSSIQVRQGDASVDYTWASEQRWGDYTTMQRNYNASQPEVWLSGSYGNSSALWQTYIAQIDGYPGMVGISEVSLNNPELAVYPNPVKDQLYIKGDLTDIYGFPELYDVAGRLQQIDVTRKGNEAYQIDVSKLMAGNYVVKVGGNHIVRFIKE